jgi:hypothetical protein
MGDIAAASFGRFQFGHAIRLLEAAEATSCACT